MRCSGQQCVAASCTDGVKNGAETDIDCGGSLCPACADDQACIESTDCTSKHCGDDGVCIAPAPDDGIQNGDETDIDCGGSIAPKCEEGQGCLSNDDCDALACGVGNTDVDNTDDVDTTTVCLPASHDDGVKNLNETDIDCGGPKAPPCTDGLICVAGSDCASKVCTAGICQKATSTDKVKNGTETDIDCGGGAPTNAPRCDVGFGCAVDSDCTSNGCSLTMKKCVEAASCKVQYGGQTCGPNGTEDCCRSLPVTGYAPPVGDPLYPLNGKTVYLDKYEITAGRMRAFVDAVTANRGGVPDIKSYMAANRPARWNLAWEAVLPSAYSGTQPGVTYEIRNPTPSQANSGALFGNLYPGADVVPSQYGVWNTPSTGAYAVMNGPQTIYPSIVNTFGEQTFFPEYPLNYTIQPYPPDYAVSHNLNCANNPGSYGFGTYWLAQSGKQFPQSEMDMRALNCTTNAMFTAFCAWDGGQLVTEDVMTYVVNGTTWPSGSCAGINGKACRIGSAGGDCVGLNLKSDSIGACLNLDPYYSPNTNNDMDDSGRIFPPGRLADSKNPVIDIVQINAGDEGWYDLKGNLMELVVSKDDRFAYNGYGIGYSSITNHRGQIITARFKEGSMGARCMRLK
ncbi:MAG: hypothetical protein FWD73_15140 [Polyangiaceae bacterium]|nr:hypothetical protein [Polyangiaceae bacterium]